MFRFTFQMKTNHWIALGLLAVAAATFRSTPHPELVFNVVGKRTWTTQASTYKAVVNPGGVSIPLVHSTLRIATSGASLDAPGQTRPANGPSHGRELLFTGVLPGIDAIYHSHGQNLEFDYRVAPGADPGSIRMVCSGADEIQLQPSGDLKAHSGQAEVTLSRPRAWQDRNGRRMPVAVAYRVDGNAVEFEIGAYDRNAALQIDPTILVNFPTEAMKQADARLSVQDIAAGRAAQAIAFGNDGALYLAGRNHAWVSKFSPTGAELFRTHLGDGARDSVNALALDARGNAHVGGTIFVDGVARGFSAVLDSAGERITQTELPSAVRALALGRAGETYLAGDGFVVRENSWKITPPGPVNALAVDSDGRLYAAGRISGDAYVARLAVEQNGPRWEWVLPLGGLGDLDEARALAAGRDGAIYVAGVTNSPDFPVKAAFQDRMAGVQDAFVARVSPDGSGTVWATYLGGRGRTSAAALALDFMGAPLLAGVTDAPDLRLAQAGSGHEDGFFARFTADGSLVESSYLQSRGTGRLFAIAVSPAGQPFVAGSSTRSVEEVTVATATAHGLSASGAASHSSAPRHSGMTLSAMTFSRIHAAGSTSSTTTLGAAPNPSAYGAPVTLTATVSPSSATGAVTFYDGTTVLGVGTLASGVATLSTITLPAGTTSLTAFYGGDSTFAASASALVPQTVNAALATTMVADSGSPFATGNNPASVVVGDFNGDGKADLAIANFADNTVTVLLGNGSGGFTAATGSPFAVGTHPASIAMADFNGDGKTDLATANSSEGTVTVLLGNGSGGFSAASGSPFTVGGNPRSVTVADFNGDGKADLATANFGSGNVTVLLGNGAGGFTAASGSPFAAGTNPFSIAVGDFNRDGHADLAVDNQGSNNVTVLLGTGTGGFTAAIGSPFAVGNHPNSVVVGDFNGDGKADLAVANFTDNTVTVLLGNGSGGFTAASGSPFAVDVHPYSIAVGDFNGDGKPDLAVANSGATDVTVLLGNGSGGFTAESGSPFVAGGNPTSVAVGDFNGDGRADLAVANLATNNISVLLGTGSPTKLAITQQPSTGTAGLAIGNVVVQVQDANGLLVTGSTAAVTLTSTPPGAAGTLTVNASGGVATFSNVVFKTAGTYTLAALSPGLTGVTSSNIAIGAAPAAVLAITSQPSAGTTGVAIGSVVVQVQDGFGNLVSGSTAAITMASNPAGVGGTVTVNAVSGVATFTNLVFGATGNYILTASSPGLTSATSASINIQAASATSLGAAPNPSVFGAPVTLTATVTPSAATGKVTFYDGTAVLGVATLAGGSATFTTTALGAGTRSLTAHYGGDSGDAASTSAAVPQTVNAVAAATLIAAGGSPVAVGNNPGTVVVGDLNVDGKADLAVANVSSNNVTVLLGNGSGGFTPASGSPFAVGNSPASIAIGDFNGDGKADLAVVNAGDNTVTVLLGTGGGGFMAMVHTIALPRVHRFVSTGGHPRSIMVGDFNGDGNADLAVADFGGGDVTVLLGNGAGGFSPATGSPIPAGTNPFSLAVADFNGDGHADIAVANQGSNNITLLLGDGNGGFTPATGSPFAVGHHPNSVTAGDFNGDGKPDLAIANYADNTVTVLLNNGSGGFTPATGSPFAVGTNPYSVAVGDINGDGKADLVVADATSGDVTVLLGNGSGGFAAAAGSPFPAGTTSVSVAVGDFNGDGRVDVAVANLGSNNITILLGSPGATQLKITQQPATGTAGTVVGNVVVQVQDSSGNVVIGSTAAVTIASTPAGVLGTLTVNAVNGVATFNSLSFNTAKTYTLTASSAGLTSATSGNIVISAAAAAKLVITAQPINGTTGTPIGNVVVQVQDSFGNLVTGSTASVLVGSTPTGVSGTTTVSAVAGVATFSNLVFNTPATYTLTASSTGLANGFSSPIAITLPASRLVITSQPASGTAGTAIANVVVQVEDANGSLVTGSTAPVTMASTPSGVSGTLTVSASGGIATFSNLVFTKATRYTLSATSPGLTTAKSTTIAISPAAANLLKIKQAPTFGKAGTLLTKMVVQVQDAFGNLVTTSTAAVTVAATGPGSFKAGSTATVNAVAGAASFTNLELDTAGTYTITASSPGLTSATTPTIRVAAGAATKLAFTLQPVNGTKNIKLPTVKVQVQDAFGNPVSSTASITMRANGPGSFTSGSTITVSAANGVAIFNNLTLATPGMYTMTASSTGLTSATSNSFTIQ
jgi:Bacterial Ig-like domain (group 3)/FG-GAP-like repeat/FG-GAP repeat